MPAIDPTSLDIPQLESLSQQLTEQRDDLSAQHKQVQSILDGKRAVVAARAQLAAMPSSEREALLRLVLEGGIESGEAFGEIGAGN